MHEIRFSFEECMLKWMKFCVFIIFFILNENACFYFWFSWMIMHILKHEIIFFIFIFSNDNEWNSIFLNDHFDPNACTIFIFFLKMILQMMIFQWTFQRQCFKKICTNFSKEKICTKDIFNDFQMFQNLCTKEHFQWFLPMCIQKVCTKIFLKYIFMYIKKYFQWFFFV